MNKKVIIITALIIGLAALIGGYLYFIYTQSSQKANHQEILHTDDTGSQAVRETVPQQSENTTPDESTVSEDWQAVHTEESFMNTGIAYLNHNEIFRGLMFGDLEKNAQIKGVGFVNQIFKQDGYDVALINLLKDSDKDKCSISFNGLSDNYALIAFQHSPRVLEGDVIAFKGMADNIKFSYKNASNISKEVPVIYVAYYKGGANLPGLELEFYTCGTMFGKPASQEDVSRFLEKNKL
ncbi:hypothetical protein [Alkanindiges illinoisensis]|uniref:hypothetical protein n=1 Tax=Alkanindiges illinoisensis TaxID=197183 RepID=UPI00047CF97F|nr:hypothetical protein [Alkanindiges illinoisensis]